MLDSAPPPLAVLTAMVTPAVLISACGLLILSTSARLTRVVDRVRGTSASLESLLSDETDAGRLRLAHAESQLELLTRRGRLIQQALTSLYVSVGVFVATVLAVAVASYVPPTGVVPPLLAVAGTLALMYGSAALIGETRLALRSIDLEMQFLTKLRKSAGRSAPSA